MTYISALPTPPSRSDDPTGFSNKADALLAALPEFVTEANALSDEVDAMRDDAESKRAATETLRDETSTLKGQAEAARDSAESYKDTTNTYRGQAEAARDSAQTIAAAYGGELGLPSLTDKSLSVMRVNEGETGVEWGPATPALDSMVILTSGTSWTCPDGVRMAVLRGVGGCGGGGRGAITPNNTRGSGAAGGEFEAIVDLVAGTTYTYAIGAGGAAAGADNTNGGTGGTTSITIGGVKFSATGGGGGLARDQYIGAIGGSATAPGGIAKYGQPGTQGEYGIVSSPGVVSSLGTQGGMGGNGPAYTIAGDAGKIVMELYK